MTFRLFNGIIKSANDWIKIQEIFYPDIYRGGTLLKKSKKIKRLDSALGTYDICRCYFKYDPNYYYFYILDYNEKIFLGVKEEDFLLDGFHINRISDIKKIEFKDDLCVKINKEKKILNDVVKPDIDLSSWKAVFKSLKKLNCYIIIKNEYQDKKESFFYIGSIKKAKRSSVLFRPFDADGIWFDDVDIPYSKITGVTFGDRYSKAFQEYLSRS